MKARSLVILWLLLVTVGAPGVACRRGPEGWPRLVQSPSTPFLATQIDKALEKVREGHATLPEEAAAARSALEEADVALSQLKEFYLPLLEATRRAYNAHQLAALGETARAQAELGHIETLLLAVAEDGSMDVVREMEEPLDLLEEARVSLGSSSPETPQRFEWLAERLELAALKGDLVLK
jgi:hypothetical protein